ncbi:phosphatidylinositol mannoside acyltransferase [Actinopolymorpha alba]|uniref:phosphatidylinositol mannoside acyltransferase n=1 Tax=Actinopolymorpha alba TaxID=533267 RepID=UPI0003612C6B|nr:phosphatidylinositol mannoside acyltransferase [Actinopolymorpha alba]
MTAKRRPPGGDARDDTDRESLPIRLKDAGADAAYSAGWALLRRLPERLALDLLGRVADVAWRRRTRGVRQLERNYARVRPDASQDELRALSRAGMRSYFRYWCEAFRLPDMRPEDVAERVVIHDEQVLWKAYNQGCGVVAALPHMGNWDLAGLWATTHGVPVTTVAERVRPERLFDRFVAYRTALGIEVLPASGGPDPMSILAERLRAGRLVCLVADRDLSARGVEVSFFGEPTRMPAGAAALALRTGAAFLPVTLWYDGPQMHLRFHDPLEKPPGSRQAIRDLTQRLADAFATGIARHPEDWHMLQRLWIADLTPAHQAALARPRAAG